MEIKTFEDVPGGRCIKQIVRHLGAVPFQRRFVGSGAMVIELGPGLQQDVPLDFPIDAADLPAAFAAFDKVLSAHIAAIQSTLEQTRKEAAQKNQTAAAAG